MARGRPKKSEDMLMKSAEMIGWAIGGIEREIAHTRERLSQLTAQAAVLRARAGARARAGFPPTAGPAGESPVIEPKVRAKRRKMSPEAKKRISEMMKKRWAERKKKAKP